MFEPRSSSPTSPTRRAASEGRVLGLDVARALALLGMVLVHFTLVGAEQHDEPAWLAGILAQLDGRAAATFVVLAGIGLAWLTREARSSRDPAAVARARTRLVRRGLFLLALGFVNLALWPGDILRVYGVSMLLASRLVLASTRTLLFLAGVIVLLFTLLVLVGDFERNWDWDTLEYRGLWTPSGSARNLLFDGFRSVLPWSAFVLYGMALGRLDLADRRTGRRVFLAGAAVALSAELASRRIVAALLAHPRSGLDEETVVALFGTLSIPALPVFLLAAGGAATAVIALCVRVSAAVPARALGPLAATGRLALTWYLAHIVLGLGALVAFGRAGRTSLGAATGYGLAFFALAVLGSWLWTRRVGQGPLEGLMRRVAG